ncbi:MAG: hypothetical protein LIO94_06915 [Clostridiales bacterium]|nr:hypothetical protein [Clostridiales bacterium]
MSALEKIFQSYYNERMDGDRETPAGITEAAVEVVDRARTMIDQDFMMVAVERYAMESEKAGFMAGFRMAWELLKNMQEGDAGQ